MNFDNIHIDLKRQRRWLLWKCDGQDKPRPYYLEGSHEDKLSSFDAVLSAFQGGGYDGLVFVVTNTPFCVVRLKNCFDTITGEVLPHAQDVINILDSYTQVSRSGKDLEVFVEGALPVKDYCNERFELFDGSSSRPIAITGNLYGEIKPIRKCQENLNALFSNCTAPEDVLVLDTDTATSTTLQMDEPEIPEIVKNSDNIPAAMKELNQWVVYGAPGKPQKIPFNPMTMLPAKAGRPETWGAFDQAIQRVKRGEALGVGFEFNSNDIVGVDLDTIRDPETGKVASYALEIIHELDSFTEISMSGYGVHIYCLGDIALEHHKRELPPNSIRRPDIDIKTGMQRADPKTGELLYKKPEIEMYNQGRYFAMTGILFEEVGCL